MKKKYKDDFYHLDNILQYNAQYNIILGTRARGKSFSVYEYSLRKYVNGGGKLGIIRRYEEDFRKGRAVNMFNNINATDKIKEITGGQFDTIIYKFGKWYLARFDESMGDYIIDADWFASPFALTAQEHYKSTEFPDITTILFDEFTTNGSYLYDEFIIFVNLLSSIIRRRDNVQIFMCGNTFNPYCPYFTEMGLKHIKEMTPDKIDLYTYGDSNLRVAVEMTDVSKKGHDSNIYFAFDNPKLNMIMGTDGTNVWALDIYPHIPEEYDRKKIMFIFFIEYNNSIFQCEIIDSDLGAYIYIHEKTTPIRKYDLIYTQRPSNDFRISTTFNYPRNRIERFILSLFNSGKVFYQNNNVGEAVAAFIKGV